LANEIERLRCEEIRPERKILQKPSRPCRDFYLFVPAASVLRCAKNLANEIWRLRREKAASRQKSSEKLALSAVLYSFLRFAKKDFK
jgi:hypothetical protein